MMKLDQAGIRRRGMGMVYTCITMVALAGLCSLGVDYGRVQLVKTELQRAADAAAMAAANNLGNGTSAASDAAVRIAAHNTADGQSVTLLASDVEFGTWDDINRVFTVLTGPAAANANAVRVTAIRAASRQTAVPLSLARLIGLSSSDVQATALAYRSSNSGGYIGISLTRMYNTARFDGYNSARGAYSAVSALPGNLLSFKDMWLYDDSRVNGEAHWDVTGVFNHDPTALIVPGPASAERLSSYYPPVSVTRVSVSNDNGRLAPYYNSNQLVIPDKVAALTYPAGTYYFTKFDIGKGNTVRFTGPTTIYLSCSGKLESTLTPVSMRPADLSVRVAPNCNWTIDSGGVFYGTFYNPTGDVHHHNGGTSYGSVISDLLCFRQTSQGHQDMSLGKYAIVAKTYLVK